MQDFKITSVGVYRHQQSHQQNIESPWLAFYVRGFRKLKLFGADGQVFFALGQDKLPVFFLGVPGMRTEFEAGKDRENWVIIFGTSNLRAAGQSSAGIEFRHRDQWLALPAVTPVAEGYVNFWRDELQLMLNAYQHPVPANLLRLELGILNLLRFILDRAQIPETEKPGPATRLKQLIDEDPAQKHNLSELSGRCGYSSDHLRLLFREQYHTSPLAYRHRQRMTRAMDLVINTTLPLKAIAVEAGFPHLTHFCTAFKKESGLSPAQAVKKYRLK